VTVTDYQCHWYPTSFYELVNGRDRYPRVEFVDGKWKFDAEQGIGWSFDPEYLSIENYFARLDAAGIDVGVSSPNMVGDVTRLEVAEASELTRLLNEETARVQNEHPDRFIGLAMLPMQDVGAAIESLDEAILELGLRGVCVLSNIAGRPMATEETLPIYKRVDELGVPLVIHPANTSMAYGVGLPLGIEVGVTWMWETSTAALSLIFSGTLDECPGLTVLHPHLGGVIPYLVGRVSAFMESWGRIAPNALQRPLAEYLRDRFYVDVAVRTPGALALAVQTYGLDRVLFATDFPFNDPAKHVEFLRATFAERDLDAIMNTNRLSFPPSRLASEPVGAA
jgi:aminocarboxymuconate-semialdehyde decarboxylase